MLRKIAIAGNVVALVVAMSPMLFFAYMMIKYRHASSIGIIGEGDGPTVIFYSIAFDPERWAPLIILSILLVLNTYVLSIHNWKATE